MSDGVAMFILCADCGLEISNSADWQAGKTKRGGLAHADCRPVVAAALAIERAALVEALEMSRAADTDAADGEALMRTALLAEREKSKRLADILGQMSTSCVPPLHNCGTCMRARAALAEAGEE